MITASTTSVPALRPAAEAEAAAKLTLTKPRLATCPRRAGFCADSQPWTGCPLCAISLPRADRRVTTHSGHRRLGLNLIRREHPHDLVRIAGDGERQRQQLPGLLRRQIVGRQETSFAP